MLSQSQAHAALEKVASKQKLYGRIGGAIGALAGLPVMRFTGLAGLRAGGHAGAAVGRTRAARGLYAKHLRRTKVDESIRREFASTGRPGMVSRSEYAGVLAGAYGGLGVGAAAAPAIGGLSGRAIGRAIGRRADRKASTAAKLKTKLVTLQTEARKKKHRNMAIGGLGIGALAALGLSAKSRD